VHPSIDSGGDAELLDDDDADDDDDDPTLMMVMVAMPAACIDLIFDAVILAAAKSIMYTAE
jgi:hypothetical protein